MPIFSASAPGKIILFGEHAVVYGRPSIAVPVIQVHAKAVVSPTLRGEPGVVIINASDVGINSPLDTLPPGDPIRETIQCVKSILKVKRIPSCNIKVSSTIPVAAGLGSGAAVSVAIIRSLSGFLGNPLPNETVSRIAYEIEKIHHGTPSGIDNTVVTYAKPVYYIKEKPIEHLKIAVPFTIIIGDTGFQSPTKEAVEDVREACQTDPKRCERIFAAIESITRTARQSIENGFPERLGPLMDENHEMLQAIGTSSPELDQLVMAAKKTGALGAKLSGGGRGGNMIALAPKEKAESISTALRRAGAVNTIITTVKDPP
jgi:mevalonate kinase